MSHVEHVERRMPLAAMAAGLLQLAMTACAVLLGVWVHLPGPALAALALLGLGIVAAAGLAGAGEIRPALVKAGVAGAWALSALAPLACLLSRGGGGALDGYHGLIAGLTAGTIFAGAWIVGNPALKGQFKALGMGWAIAGCLLWTAGAYAGDWKGGFFGGLGVFLALLIGCRAGFRLNGLAIQAVNTLILTVIGLPLADWLVSPPERLEPAPGNFRACYSFEAARHDPDAFGRWWRYYLGQWDAMGKEVFMRDPGRALPFRLRPGARGRLFQSLIAINSLGFRGPETTWEKRDGAYRIVALGESTTFGCTLLPGDTPWPELLERMIRERLHPRRPVEVINAGIPSFTIELNLRRIASDILPLHPDLILSYHGLNGFRLLDPALPSLSGQSPPIYMARPLKLLADCEYRWKVLCHRRRLTAGVRARRPDFSHLLDSPYAQAYSALIQIAQTNGMRLALANFSMAVNARSQPAVVEFYGATFPVVTWLIQANAAHSQLVEELARRHPQVCLVDTHPGLDGVHTKFIDLAHMTQEGRQQLAENVFAGIRKTLEKDLAP